MENEKWKEQIGTLRKYKYKYAKNSKIEFL